MYIICHSEDNYLTGEEHEMIEMEKVGEYENEQDAKDAMKVFLKEEADLYRNDPNYYIKYEDYFMNELLVHDSYGGFIGHSGDRNAVKLTDCLFSGTINDNTNKGYVAPFTAYTSSSYNAVYTNCLNNGTFNTNPSSTIVLWDGSKATFSNCYYKAGNYSSDYVYGTSVSAYQLAQGEIAFNLQGDRTEQHWGQVIGTDLAPVLTNDPNKWVYKINEYKYSNNPNDSGILTGISHVEQSSMAEGQNDEWFTPEGQKLNGRPTAKGIYIRNGRKVILK
jgi:archaellum component FlaF (FlaF/FlaG flagellin family)